MRGKGSQAVPRPYRPASSDGIAWGRAQWRCSHLRASGRPGKRHKATSLSTGLNSRSGNAQCLELHSPPSHNSILSLSVSFLAISHLIVTIFAVIHTSSPVGMTQASHTFQHSSCAHLITTNDLECKHRPALSLALTGLGGLAEAPGSCTLLAFLEWSLRMSRWHLASIPRRKWLSFSSFQIPLARPCSHWDNSTPDGF